MKNSISFTVTAEPELVTFFKKEQLRSKITIEQRFYQYFLTIMEDSNFIVN